MMKYLDGEEQLTQEELEGLFDKAIAQELFIPVFVGSTIIKQGIQGLMEDICTYFPHPTAHGAFRLADGGEIRVTKGDQQAAGFVFKTLSDPFVGRLSFIKVFSGVFAPGVELVNSRTRKKERLGHVCIMKGKETIDVKSAMAGDIIVVPKLADTRTGDTLSHTGDIAIDPLPLPIPQYPVAIEAVNKKEEDKLGTFLARVAENDPTIRIERCEETHQTVITAMGDAQIETILSRLKDQANVEARLVRIVRLSARPLRRRVVIRSRLAVPASSAIAGCALSRIPVRATNSSMLSRVAQFLTVSFPLLTRASRKQCLKDFWRDILWWTSSARFMMAHTTRSTRTKWLSRPRHA